MVSGIELVLNYCGKNVSCVLRCSETGTLEVHIPEDTSMVVKVQRDLENICDCDSIAESVDMQFVKLGNKDLTRFTELAYRVNIELCVNVTECTMLTRKLNTNGDTCSLYGYLCGDLGLVYFTKGIHKELKSYAKEGVKKVRLKSVPKIPAFLNEAGTGISRIDYFKKYSKRIYTVVK